MVCDCLIEISSAFIEKTFTYNIPLTFINKLQVGMRVKVWFGKQLLEGFVLKIYEKNTDLELKDIVEIVDDYPVLNEELLNLGKYIKDNTLCTLITAYQAMLPLALKAKHKVNMNIKKDIYIRLKDNYLNETYNQSQLKIINHLKEKQEEKQEILNKISVSSVKTLLKKGVIEQIEKEVFRYNIDNINKTTYKLNEEQQNVCNEIINSDGNNTFLIHGVTGSGKTNVYMEIIDNIIKKGKTAIILVPEISLTPQIINRFTSKFDRIAVLHSGLSDGEKYDEWRKIKEEKVDIVIGARSAIFAPLKNIGVIIIDEEHSNTYKQENNPRYHAIDIAKKRCEYHNIPLVLGSATPSLETYARAKKNVYKLLELKKRFNNQKLPQIEIIDMNKEFKKANGYFSNKLLNEIQDRINKNEQTIIFLNRRGYSSTITCKNCGFIEKCPNCDISLTYHKSSNMLRCHYCGFAEKRQNNCPNCHEEVKDFGIGTEKVEEELNKILNNAKIIRMDIDTTTKKKAHENIIKDFDEGKYNILLGTQMIAKGLDFPNCTLVGIINADISLNFPDFRASETTFQLLNQVAGRSGRGQKEGLVLIQTFNPEHYAIKYTKNNDYCGFYQEEMAIRKKLNYPPYYYICLIKIISKEYNIASDTSIKISNHLKKTLNQEIILGPSVANQFKLNNNYRFQIIIKYKNINNIIETLTQLQQHYFNQKNIKIEIDFNPMKL